MGYGNRRNELRRILREASRRAALFNNDEVWINAEGRYIPIEQMSARYAENTMRMLEQQALQDYEQVYLWENRDNDDADEFDAEFADARKWLRGTPLYKALKAANERPF